MKTPFQSCSKPVRFLGVAFSLAMSLGTVGVLVMPAAAFAATSSPAVDQQPLTVQPTVPPNIVLMLDDSGSMRADYMPDYSYIPYQSNDAMINAANSGLYYDPTVTYAAPPHADGTFFTTQTDMTNVPQNGISGTNAVNLTNYNSTYECDHSQNCGLKSDGTPRGHIYFSTLIPNAALLTLSQSMSSSNACTALYNSYLGASGGATYNNGKNICTFQYKPGYFQYSTGAASSPSVHYVAAASADCGSMTSTSSPSCVAASDTSGAAAPAGVSVGQNIANWFAYYHTRILMAKSGLMNAFVNISPNFRFGFASINANGVGAIPATPTPFTFDDSTSGGGSTTNQLAVVQPFGLASTAGSQKNNFWTWIEAEYAGSNTPLRKALQGVGMYYQSKQPWDSMTGDPGYSSTGTNSPLACRAAYTILTTDGFWNGETPSGIGNADGTTGPAVTGPNGQTYTYTAAAPYSDKNSDTLADVAMYYWENDLQNGGSGYTLDNEVPTSSEDPAFWQHMTTFTMGLGFTPMYADQTTQIPVDKVFDWANGGTAISPFSWPKPSSNSVNNIADLAHAAVDGHGAFFSVKSPQAFTAGIQAALSRVSERVGTGASLAANSTSLTTGTVIYQANYYTSVWKGDLKAFAVDANTGAIATTPTWQAANEMPAAADRIIETYNTSTGKFVAFKNGTSAAPSLSATQLTALGATTAEQEAIVNYLRGNASAEVKNGGAYRSRDTALGDVVHSQPVYSGAPSANEFVNQGFLGTITDTSTSTIPFYDWAVGTTDSSGTFTASAASKRTPLIFVAANDGMLHVFNASTSNFTLSNSTVVAPGGEVYAYLPGSVINAGIKDLSDPNYGQSSDPHQYFNDGQLTIADAYIDTGDGSGQSWHTILVGTSGLGLAKTVYALDITDPSSITPLWERSAGDGKAGSDYIGQMVGKPVIAQTNYVAADAKTSTAASSTWSVLIGNGYNSTQGKAALLQFNLANGTLSVHKTDTMTGNGLAAPLAWMDTPTNGVSDIAYAGDVLGRVWSFALNDNTGANADLTSSGNLLFTAEDSAGKAQPIAAGMLAGTNPANGDVWLFFGTGQYLSDADLSNTDTQTWYGIIVQSTTNKIVSNLSNGRSALTERTITGQTNASGTTLAARSVSAPVTNSKGTTDMDGKSGWYMDLLAPVGVGNAPVQQGERMIDPNQFQGNVLIGVTRIPKVSDVCNPSGTGWIMALDPFTGSAPANDFFDINGDGSINSSDQVGGNVAAGVGFSSLPNAPIFVGGSMETSFDNGTNSTINTAGSSGSMGRVSWRELVNP